MSNVIDQNDILAHVRDELRGYSDHGTSEAEWKELRTLLLSVQPTDTENRTVFPDFVGTTGFIEHFHVTSGPNKKKGYANTEKESKMDQAHENWAKSTCEELDRNNAPSCVVSHATSFWREGDSVENFHKSFKTVWKKHIESLHNYGGDKHIACFMISSDDMLCVHEHPGNRTENELFFGDMTKDDIKYCLAYDDALLDFMYEYCTDVDYVIYYSIFRRYAELIKVSNIPALKAWLPKHDYLLDSCVGMESSFSSVVRVHM